MNSLSVVMCRVCGYKKNVRLGKNRTAELDKVSTCDNCNTTDGNLFRDTGETVEEPEEDKPKRGRPAKETQEEEKPEWLKD
jgi:hypothetical protein